VLKFRLWQAVLTEEVTVDAMNPKDSLTEMERSVREQ